MAKMEIGAELARPCPYMGLFPFGAEDARFFFGRGSDADLIAANVLSARVLVLHGPSGVGKSSVLQAALPCSLDRILPDPLVVTARRWDCGFYGALLQHAKQQGWDAYKRYGAKHRWSGDDEERELFIGCHEPEAPPLEPGSAPPPPLRGGALASPSGPGPKYYGGDARRSLPPHATRKTRGDRKMAKRNSLERYAELWAKGVGTPVVFVFDQFEQYFIGQDFGANVEDHEFEADFARIVKRRDLSVHVLISIREDALHELNRLRARIPNILVRSLKLDYLDEAAAREAINGPLRVWSKEHHADAGPTATSPELTEELIRQVSRNGDGACIETPYLQLALKRLWEEERRLGSPKLRSETLNALGGASGIAKSHFEDTMKALPEDEQRLCATIFDRMVTPSGMKIALPAADLARFAQEDPEWVRGVLEKLTHGPSRIIHCVSSPSNDKLVLFEIFHDVLAAPILDWKREIEAQQERIQHQRQVDKERQLKRKWRSRFFAATAYAVFLMLLAGGLYMEREAGLQRAQLLTMQANRATERGDSRLALLTALQAVPEGSGWLDRWFLPITPESVSALARAAYRPIGPVLSGHKGRLTDLAYSPDGRLIVTASDDGTARVWNAHTGTALPLVFEHGARVSSAAFDAQSAHVLTMSDDGRAHIWQASSGKEIVSWRAEAPSARAAEFSPAGGLIATAGRRNSPVRMWTWDGAGTPVPAPVSTLGEDGAEWRAAITSLAFDPTGALLMTTAWDQPTRIWSTRTGKLVYELAAPSKEQASEDAVLYAKFSSDGRRVVTASRDGKARIWELPIAPFITTPVLDCDGASCMPLPAELDGRLNPRLILTLKGHVEQVGFADFDAAGERVITASSDGTVRFWDASSGEMLRLLQGPADGAGLRALAALSPDGSRLVTSFSEKLAHLWTVATGPEMPVMIKLPRKATALAASEDDHRLAVAVDATISVYDSASGEKIIPDFDTDLPALSLAFDKGSDRLAVAGGSAADIWNVKRPSAQLLSRLSGHRSLILSLAYDRAGRQLVTASQDGTARIWDPETGAQRQILSGHQGAVFAAVFNEDGRRVVTGSFDGTMRLWNAATGRQIGDPIWIHRPVLALAPGQDENEIVVTALEEPSSTQPFRTSTGVWDLRDRMWVRDSEDRTLRTAGYLIRSASDSDLRLTDALGNTLALLPRHRDGVTDMTSGGSGELVYTASMDGMVRAWKLVPADPERLISYARRMAMTLPEDQRSLSADEQRALGLSPAKMWLNLGGAVGTLMEAIRRSPRETELAGM
jgi:WD40 repeat protein